MEKLFLLLILPLITALILTACKPKDSSLSSSSLVISDVNIVDVADGEIKADQTVIVDSNHITEIGPSESFSIPDEATVINAKGKYLIPGLWDMHAHTSYDKITRNVFFRYM